MLIYINSGRELSKAEIQSIRVAAVAENPDKKIKQSLQDVENIIHEDGGLIVIVGKPPRRINYETDVKTKRNITAHKKT